MALTSRSAQRVMHQGEPAVDAVAITPSDSVDLNTDGTPTRAIYVGTTGNINAIMDSGNTALFTAVPVGIFWISVKRVKATSTTATNMLALY